MIDIAELKLTMLLREATSADFETRMYVEFLHPKTKEHKKGVLYKIKDDMLHIIDIADQIFIVDPKIVMPSEKFKKL